VSEKPLHVRVAEALGWTELRKVGGILIADNWAGWPPGALPLVGQPRPEAIAPRYDTDWSATGPLIEKYGIGIQRDGLEGFWMAWVNGKSPTQSEDETPLVAVCYLILALKEAGKLEAA
jgi:uncharacterized protein DUF2591